MHYYFLDASRLCLKIGHPRFQWLIIIFPMKTQALVGIEGLCGYPLFSGKPNTGEPFDSEALSALEGQGAPNVNHQKLGVLVKIIICKSLHYTYEVSINAGSSKSLAQWKKLYSMICLVVA